MAENKVPKGSDDDVMRVAMVFGGAALLLRAATDWENASTFSVALGCYLVALAIGWDALFAPLVGAGFAAAKAFNRLRSSGRVNRKAELDNIRDAELLKANGGPRPVPTLKELADDAFAVLAAESDDRAQRFVDGMRRPDLDLLRELYGHCRCDWFAGALHVMTGWQIVAAGSPGSAPVHLLVRDSAGRLVDVYGYVTVADLRERYGVADLEIFEPGDMHSGHDLAVEHVPSVAASMLYLELEPFVSLRTEVLDWVTSLPEASQIGAQSLAERRIPINGVPQESVV